MRASLAQLKIDNGLFTQERHHATANLSLLIKPSDLSQIVYLKYADHYCCKKQSKHLTLE